MAFRCQSPLNIPGRAHACAISITKRDYKLTNSEAFTFRSMPCRFVVIGFEQEANRTCQHIEIHCASEKFLQSGASLLPKKKTQLIVGIVSVVLLISLFWILPVVPLYLLDGLREESPPLVQHLLHVFKVGRAQVKELC